MRLIILEQLFLYTQRKYNQINVKIMWKITYNFIN